MPMKMDAIKVRLGALKGLGEMFLGPRDVIAVDVGGRSIKRAGRPRPPLEKRNGDEPCLEQHQN